MVRKAEGGITVVRRPKFFTTHLQRWQSRRPESASHRSWQVDSTVDLATGPGFIGTEVGTCRLIRAVSCDLEEACFADSF